MLNAFENVWITIVLDLTISSCLLLLSKPVRQRFPDPHLYTIITARRSWPGRRPEHVTPYSVSLHGSVWTSCQPRQIQWACVVVIESFSAITVLMAVFTNVNVNACCLGRHLYWFASSSLY
jgi:hypothetical protein